MLNKLQLCGQDMAVMPGAYPGGLMGHVVQVVDMAMRAACKVRATSITKQHPSA